MVVRLFFLRLVWAAAFAAGACVQTNVTRTPRDEEAARPTAAATASAGYSAAAAPSPARTPEPFVAAASASAPATTDPAPSSTPPAPSPAPGVVAADPVRLEAPGCRSAGRHLRIPILRPNELDRSYRGAVAGIEIRKTVLAGSGGFRHAKLQGGHLDVDLWARGDGIAIGALGQGSCSGSFAAAVVFEVIPHYR